MGRTSIAGTVISSMFRTCNTYISLLHKRSDNLSNCAWIMKLPAARCSQENVKDFKLDGTLFTTDRSVSRCIMNIACNLENSAFYFPENIAVIDHGRAIRFDQLNRDAGRVASALQHRGVQHSTARAAGQRIRRARHRLYRRSKRSAVAVCSPEIVRESAPGRLQGSEGICFCGGVA